LEIVGHRGAKGIAPENTLVGFQVALELGVDMIELDVHLSKDGELVVIHDPRLERTTDGRGLVSAYTLAELKELDAAARFEGDTSYGVQRIPTLEEVYALVQGRTRINVEIKRTADGERYPGIEGKVVESVRRNDALAYTIISSFDFPTRSKSLNPSWPVMPSSLPTIFARWDCRVNGPRTSWPISRRTASTRWL
jgi:glycerophosphoryl diester phosphodiesterase